MGVDEQKVTGSMEGKVTLLGEKGLCVWIAVYTVS